MDFKSKAWKIARIAGNAAGKSIDTVKLKAGEKAEQFADDQKPVSADNWYERTASACENLADAIMWETGWTNKIVKVASAKLGAVAVPASIFSVAALVGTASTGTAIGSLSGAAFTSSALAWIGGSVAMGTVVVGTATLGGLLVAPLLLKPLSNKYLHGKARKPEELSKVEKDVVDACCALALGLRQSGKEGARLNSQQALALHNDALRPLLDKVADVLWISNEWPILQRRKFSNAFGALGLSKGFARHILVHQEPVTIGLGTAIVLNLLSEGEHSFSNAEQDVLDAVRRSSRTMSGATNEEIAAHVQAMTPQQLVGFKNNVKGIAHEIRYARTENADGDEYFVELFEATNHAGADIRLINTATGDVQELQLKATSYGAYVESHFERYPEIGVLATSEVAQELGIGSTGIANRALEQDMESALSELDADLDPTVLNSMVLAGLVMLARNVNVILTSEPNQDARRKRMVVDATKAGLVAGIAELLI